jgi:hypothetical protein
MSLNDFTTTIVSLRVEPVDDLTVSEENVRLMLPAEWLGAKAPAATPEPDSGQTPS